MEFRLRERPIFKIKRTVDPRRDRKLIEFLRKHSNRINLGGISIESGSDSKYGDNVFYAKGEKGIIGACSIVSYSRGLILCYNLSVLKEFRREGVGTALIRNVIDYASIEKIHNILVLSEISNKEAKKFLKKIGFRKIGKIRRLFNNKDYIMWEYLP
ncbi:MAG: GCN5-related N-acetyltransferase [Candidatus Parvarchaeum acidophilus ARMAN-5]|jgi:RimJ/RimL family protein N-acetyltransferase|uniref:GCN5-related N-acetyltransferase n=1 Tax=Candidatus Parvarchaeum acidophilus ARMAN-5 TaxID=662762 RepID=D6GUQ3_PARA5|nr:MAG: GCN5-related N-acetyltransferase [Candidatus Parvarchaeum acidophilus ARMAN-5]